MPSFDECEAAVKAGEASALQRFIYENEPSGEDRMRDFRLRLAELVAEARQPPPPRPKREAVPGVRFYCGSPNKPPRGSGFPFSSEDRWNIMPNGDRCCSFCGSLHEEDFLAILEGYADGKEGYRFDPSTKPYKRYASRPGDGGIKFYTWHVDPTPGPELDRKQALFERAVARHRREMAEKYGV